MRENQSQYAVLSLLRLEPMTGYDISQACDSIFSHFWSESYGSIYPMLKRLERQKWIRRCKSREPESGRKKQAYEITAAGRKSLTEWLVRPPQNRSLRDELVLKLFSGTVVPTDVHLGHIRRLRGELEALKAELAIRNRELNRSYSEMPDYPHWKLILRAGVLTCEARLKWCKEAIDLLEGLPE